MAVACVRVLTQIGGEAAIEVLTRYTNDFTQAVVEALVFGLQDSDDKQVYADRLLSHITDLALYSALPLEYLQYVPNLTMLTLRNLPEASDLSMLAQLPNLSTLKLGYLPEASDLSMLGQLPISTSLSLWNLPEASVLSVLGQLSNLSTLSLEYLPKASD